MSGLPPRAAPVDGGAEGPGSRASDPGRDVRDEIRVPRERPDALEAGLGRSAGSRA